MARTEHVPFDLAKALTLRDAARLLRGQGGRTPALETVRRWAAPARGCFPAGKDGPRVVLRTVKLSGEVLTMPEWCADFERERVRLGMREVR